MSESSAVPSQLSEKRVWAGLTVGQWSQILAQQAAHEPDAPLTEAEEAFSYIRERIDAAARECPTCSVDPGQRHQRYCARAGEIWEGDDA